MSALPRDLHGIINLHKPAGITSAKALYRVRSLVGQRRSGHAGTLDPAASGVLVLCLGRATRLVERVMDQPKGYRAVARLDVTSESFDADRTMTPVAVDAVPSAEAVAAALAGFEGAIAQVPPRVSAIKVGGVPAYRRRADDAALVLAPRTVRVYWLVMRRYAWPEVEFEMACGRGTYVRALARDLGERLGTGGCLTSLVRTRVGPFSIEESATLEALREASDPAACLIELERAMALLDPGAMTIPPRPVA